VYGLEESFYEKYEDFYLALFYMSMSSSRASLRKQDKYKLEVSNSRLREITGKIFSTCQRLQFVAEFFSHEAVSAIWWGSSARARAVGFY
jgi:hypothetical protein